MIAITHERNSWKDEKDDRVGNNKYLNLFIGKERLIREKEGLEEEY